MVSRSSDRTYGCTVYIIAGELKPPLVQKLNIFFTNYGEKSQIQTQQVYQLERPKWSCLYFSLLIKMAFFGIVNFEN